MPDNFHDADCALRHGGKECTCGYVKPLTGQEKELARLRAELAEIRTAIKEAAEYFDHNCLNFQYEKMKDYILELKRLSAPEPKHG